MLLYRNSGLPPAFFFIRYPFVVFVVVIALSSCTAASPAHDAALHPTAPKNIELPQNPATNQHAIENTPRAEAPLAPPARLASLGTLDLTENYESSISSFAHSSHESKVADLKRRLSGFHIIFVCGMLVAEKAALLEAYPSLKNYADNCFDEQARLMKRLGVSSEVLILDSWAPPSQNAHRIRIAILSSSLPVILFPQSKGGVDALYALFGDALASIHLESDTSSTPYTGAPQLPAYFPERVLKRIRAKVEGMVCLQCPVHGAQLPSFLMQGSLGRSELFPEWIQKLAEIRDEMRPELLSELFKTTQFLEWMHSHSVISVLAPHDEVVSPENATIPESSIVNIADAPSHGGTSSYTGNEVYFNRSLMTATLFELLLKNISVSASR